MQDIDDDDTETLFISFSIDTKITRVTGNTLIPSKISIRADVNPTEDADEVDLNLALSKIKFWYESLVTKSIAFNQCNEHAMAMFIDPTGKNRTSNLLMLTPGDPTDEVLAALFQAKMTALANGAIEFGLVEVKSDNLAGLSFIFVGDGESALPDIEEWIGERSFFDKPWWCRNDASTLDIVPPEDADLTKKPAWAFSLDATAHPKPETGIVVRPAFRPTVIAGGKTGDKPEPTQ